MLAESMVAKLTVHTAINVVELSVETLVVLQTTLFLDSWLVIWLLVMAV